MVNIQQRNEIAKKKKGQTQYKNRIVVGSEYSEKGRVHIQQRLTHKIGR